MSVMLWRVDGASAYGSCAMTDDPGPSISLAGARMRRHMTALQIPNDLDEVSRVPAERGPVPALGARNYGKRDCLGLNRCKPHRCGRLGRNPQHKPNNRRRYSTTSTTWASNDAGTVRPSTLAALRLMKRSNCVGCPYFLVMPSSIKLMCRILPLALHSELN